MSQPSSGTRVPFVRTPPSTLLRLASVGILLAALAAALWAAYARPSLVLESVVSEKHVVYERLQIVGWVLVIVLATVAAAIGRRTQALLLAVWLGVGASLAVLRELDLHVVLNPDNIHLLGLTPEQAVRFRLDWWTDPRESVLLKLAWAVALLGLVSLVVVPLVAARYPWLKLIRRGRLFPILIAAGFAGLAGGFLLDDVGRPLTKAGVDLAVAEEVVELLGVVLLAAATGLLAAGRLPTLDSTPPAEREPVK